MEKIYEEQQFSQRKKNNLNGSVILSFVVAFFAIFSLIVCGFNEISYAAPEGPAEKINFYHYVKDGEEVEIMAVTDTTFIQTPLFFSDAAFTKPLFCVEHTVDPSDSGAELTLINSNPAEGTNSDAGITYIINNSFVRGKNMLPGSSRDAEAFATQMAIWAYLATKYPTNTIYAFEPEQLDALVNAKKIQYRFASDYVDLYSAETSIYKTYIEPIVTRALTQNFAQKVIVTKGNDSITKVEDGKYYQTSKITVTGDPESELESFDFELKGVEGAFAVNASNGEKISSLSNIPKGTDFYVRVPADKVSETLQELRIEVSGHFNTFLTNDYGESGKQKVISIDDSTRIFVKGTDYDVVGAPNTKMSVAQTVYFIGLIVLLCGVGIIYANAKPIENK